MYDLKQGERIKDVKGYEGVYAVTSFGRVWSYRRKIWIKPWDDSHGYQKVTLSVYNHHNMQRLHRLVGQAFLENPDNKPQINHRNGVKTDCRASNLEWVTARENLQHAGDNNLNKVFRFSYIDKINICKMYHTLKLKKVYLAKLFLVTPPAISYIIKTYSGLALA